MCALLLISQTSQSALNPEVFVQILASHPAIHLLAIVLESHETCDHKIITGVENPQNGITQDRLIVLVATALEVMTMPVVIVSLLTAAISIEALSAIIRQETMLMIDQEDHQYAIMGLLCGTPSDLLGSDQQLRRHVADLARSVSHPNGVYRHRGVKLGRKVKEL